MYRITLAFIAITTAAHAKPLALPQDALETWVPDSWMVANENGMTAVASPNQAASAFFVSKPIRDLDVAYKKLGDVIKPIIPGIQFGKPSRTTIGGLSAIMIKGVAELAGEGGETVTLEATIVVVATPNQRALYAGTIVHAEHASAYDATLTKIIAGLSRPQQKAAGKPGPNLCWEFKGHPNGWRSQSWKGVKFLLPAEWRHQASEDPDTGTPVLQISHEDGSSVVVFAVASNSAAEAWAVVEQAADYRLGKPAQGSVSGQPALCARGSGGGTTDAVVMHKGSSALVMLSRGAGDGAANRAILGSVRWSQ